MRAARDSTSLPGPGPGRWVAVSQLFLGVLWLTLGVGGADGSRRFHVGLGLAGLTLGLFSLRTARTRLDSRGLRPAGAVRRIPWARISSACVTSSPARRGYVAVVVDGRPHPVWVKDPDRVTVQRWTAQTGRRGTSYG